MPGPVLLAVDDDGECLSAITRELGHRYSRDYRIVCTGSPDEVFHQTISSFLLEWARDRRTAPHTIRVVGEGWSGRAYELREILGRCAIPHSFCLADSTEGQSLLAGADGAQLPVVIFPDGNVLTDP